MTTHTHTQQCTENVTKASSFHLICNKLGSDYFHFKITWLAGLPWWFSGKESTCQWGRHGFDPQSGKIPRAGAIKPLCHNYWACILEPGNSNKRSHTVRSPHTTTQECPRSLPTRAKPTEQWRPRTAKNKQLTTKNKNNLTCKNSTKNSHISLTQDIINNNSKITKGQETNTNTILTTNLQLVNFTNHALIPFLGFRMQSRVKYCIYLLLLLNHLWSGIFFQSLFFFFFFLTEQHAGS